MRTTARWALWRRTQYITGFCIFLLLVGTGVYYGAFYTPANCFDGAQNGSEYAIDCGGSCVRICAFQVTPPKVLWARAFRIVPGQYNAVAYVENRNEIAATKKVHYTFSLYDAEGLITKRSGTTELPPDSVYPIFEGRIDTGSRVPTQTFITIDGEAVWQPATNGREQFSIEGRRLSDVNSKPRLYAQIFNTAVTSAVNVEVVATIFDKNGNALTSSRTIVPRFSGEATKSIVFTWPEPIAKTIRSCEVPTDVMLAIDLSGSMNNDGGDPPQPVTAVLHSAGAFVENMQKGDQAGVVTFATKASLADTLTNDLGGVKNDILALAITPEAEHGYTNVGDAIKAVQKEFASKRQNENARTVMVLLTDGLANAHGEESEQYALDAAAALRAEGVQVYAIGLGEGVNKSFLKNLVTDSNHYYFAPSTGTLDRIYAKITGAICEDGPAIIDIIPKTTASFKPLR